MKVLLINGSPRPGGNTTLALAEMKKGMTVLYCNYEDCAESAQLRPYEAKVFWQPVTEGGK